MTNVLFLFTDSQGQPLTASQISNPLLRFGASQRLYLEVWPTSTPDAYNNGTSTGRKIESDIVNGTASLSLVPQFYWVKVMDGSQPEQPFVINVPDTGSVVNANTLIVVPTKNQNFPNSSSTAYPIAISDLRYAWADANYPKTASWAINTVSNQNGGLVTGQTYPITASWAVNSTSGGSGGTTLFTASTYQITSSWSVNAQNITSSGVSGTVGNATNAGTSRTASFVTASNVIGKVSTATTADTASYAGNYLLKTTDTGSNLLMDNIVISSNGTLNFQDLDVASRTDFSIHIDNNDILGIYDRFGNVIRIAKNAVSASLFGTASWATSVVNKGTTLFTASTYQITSSWANNAVNSTNTITADTASTMLNPSGLKIDAAGNITGAASIFCSQTIEGATFIGDGSQLTGIVSSSYSNTASYISPYSAYSTLATSSAKWITASFAQPNQFVLINVAGIYNFTSSNHPPAGQVADVILHVSNSLNLSSSLSFPTAWKNMNVNGSWPNQISASTEIFVWLHAKDLAQKIYGSVAMN